MAWQDRDYNRGSGAGDFLSNPASILAFSIPFGTWFGVRVRLHFWLLLTIAFGVASLLAHASIVMLGIAVVLLLFTLMMHDFGHKFFAQFQGGRLDEFMLWPMGGMVFPTMPPGPWPMFVGYIGGIAVNFVLALGTYVLIWVRYGEMLRLPLNPLLAFGTFVISSRQSNDLMFDVLRYFTLINWSLVLGNLLPYFWFDGGTLLQSILTPIAGSMPALNITCILGMILAVPMFCVALVGQDFLGMILWVLLFSSSYNARSTVPLMDSETSFAPASNEGGWRARRWAKSGAGAARANAKRKREEEKIDAILQKVSTHGMHSLTWLEKRTLKKASQRLR